MWYKKIINFFGITKFLLIRIHLNYLIDVEIIKIVKLSFIGKHLKVIKITKLQKRNVILDSYIIY